MSEHNEQNEQHNPQESQEQGVHNPVQPAEGQESVPAEGQVLPAPESAPEPDDSHDGA